jgi:hypothetical protein
MLSDNGYNIFKRLVVCRKMLSNSGIIFSKPTRTNWTSFFLVRYTTNDWRVAHNCLQFHAYKVQALQPDDTAHLFNFTKDIFSSIAADGNYLQR